MYNQTIPNTILSTIIALATMGIASEANAGGTDKCGNGYVNWGEECDDGNTSNTDACTNECECAECGDGFVWTGMEQCDDANEVDNDGCTNECELPKCGDGIVQGDEECDDGNEVNDDECTNSC
jgi:cysteine-rich repeat protein